MPTEKPRYCITVDDETLKEIDDFRFKIVTTAVPKQHWS